MYMHYTYIPDDRSESFLTSFSVVFYTRITHLRTRGTDEVTMRIGGRDRMWVAVKRACRGVTGNATPPSRRASDHSLQVIPYMLQHSVSSCTVA